MKLWQGGLCLFLLAIDLLSKKWALHSLPLVDWIAGYPYGGVPVFQWAGVSFSLNFVTNSGAAWGLFSGHAGLLFALRTAIIALFVGYLWTARQKASFFLWLIVAGAIGNAIDYCLYGHVIDFFHFHFAGWTFPLFNCADSYITVGGAAFLFFPSKKPEALASP